MKIKLSELLHGSVRIKVTGAKPQDVLNAMSERSVSFWDAVPEDEFTIGLGIYSSDLSEVRSIAERRQCSVQKLRERGAPVLRRKMRRRVALLGTAVSCFVLLAASSLFVWDIDVEGNESVTTGEILRALSDAGVYPGSFWPGWSSDDIRNSVILDIPDLAWLGVSVDSSRAVVRVRERVEKPPVVQSTDAGSVTARTTGIIERMEVYQGAPLVARGDAVVAGETLVSGEMPSEVGDTRYVRASALVEARTWYERSAAAPLEYEALTSDGGYTHWALILGDKRINFYAGSSQTPSGCGKIITEYTLEWPGVFSLPVTLVRERISEYEKAPAAQSETELTASLELGLRSTLERELTGRGEILNATFTSSVSGGMLIVTMRAECLEDIAVYTPANQ